MNCQEFQSNVDAVARGSLADARTRGEAAAHEEACATCAARLADERALTAGLRALAAKMSGASAPARAESALLAAFRSRAAEASNAEVAASATAARPTTAASTTASHSTTAAQSRTAAAPTTHAASNVVSLSEHAGARHWSWVKTVAVASLAAAAVALLMLVPPILTPAPGGSGESAASRPRSAPTVQTHEGVRPVEAAGAGASQGSEPSEVAGSRESQDGGGVDAPPVRPSDRRRAAAPVRALNAGFGRGLTNAGSRVGSLASEREGVVEVTTDFIPLMQGAAFTQTEAARLVRVEIPRAALASFGIPLNGERAGGRVKADLLLGEDGTARAIRFVR
jgi:hypothetical protein